jgi:hypothetical protein
VNVRTPRELAALVAVVDGMPALHSTEGKRYVALADAVIPDAAASELGAWDKPGERAVVLGKDVLAELTVDFHKLTLTNARIEGITGRTTTWRDLHFVRAIVGKWCA